MDLNSMTAIRHSIASASVYDAKSVYEVLAKMVCMKLKQVAGRENQPRCQDFTR